jgi:hypothetical protein
MGGETTELVDANVRSRQSCRSPPQKITVPQLGLGHFSLVDKGSQIEERHHKRTRVSESRGSLNFSQSPEISRKQGNFMKFSIELFLALSFTGASRARWQGEGEEPMRSWSSLSLRIGYLSHSRTALA